MKEKNIKVSILIFVFCQKFSFSFNSRKYNRDTKILNLPLALLLGIERWVGFFIGLLVISLFPNSSGL